MLEYLLLQTPDGSNDLGVFTANLLWAAFACAAGIFYLPRLRDRLSRGLCDEASRLMAGIVAVSFGTCLHRLYWACWRAVRMFYGQDSYQAVHFIDYAHWFNIAILLACVGYSLHAYPVLHRLHGKFWWLGAMGWGAVWYLAAVAIGVLAYN